MSKGLSWRVVLICAFMLLSFLYLTPTVVPKLPSWWTGFLPKDKIHLGLDLQGGSHLVMEVDTPKAVEGTLDLIATDLEDSLTAQNLRFKHSGKVGGDRVQLVFYDRATADEAQKLVKKKYPEMEIVPLLLRLIAVDALEGDVGIEVLRGLLCTPSYCLPEWLLREGPGDNMDNGPGAANHRLLGGRL